jgi:hypothetical protein
MAASQSRGEVTQGGMRGMAYDFNIAARRAEERSEVEKAETAYNDLTSRWRTRPKEKKAMENPDLQADWTIQQHPFASASPVRCSATRPCDSLPSREWHLK